MARSEISMPLRLALAAGTFAAVSAAVMTSLPSCNGPPEKTCFADHVNALGVDEDAGPDRECTTCLQTKACCDAVGACDDDPTKACAPAFKAAQLCVADGGPAEEARCKGLLTNDLSKNLYQCMRDTCGEKCGVPSCSVSAAVPLIVNPTCDRCVGLSCCDKLGACYAEDERNCGFALDCITTHCAATVGPSLQALEQLPPDELRAVRDRVCAGEPLPGGADSCWQRCFDDFAPGGGGATTDDLDARCKAFDVLTCGAGAKCGSRCVAPDAGPYAPDGSWPDH